MNKGYVYINDTVFPTLLAISEQEQQKGLMHQAWPPPVMSFVYDHPRVNKFWMQNTPSPLDIVFCQNGKVSQIHYGAPHSTDMIGDNNLSDLIIELPHGSVFSEGIRIGHKAGLVAPTYNEVRKIIAKNRFFL